MHSPFLLAGLRPSGHVLGHFQGGLGDDVFWTLRNVSTVFTAFMKFTYTFRYKVAFTFILLQTEQYANCQANGIQLLSDPFLPCSPYVSACEDKAREASRGERG